MVGLLLLSLPVLWVMYVTVMYIKKKYEQGKIPRWLYWILIPFVVIGYLFDVFVNITVGSVLFWHLPEFKDSAIPYLPTLSERLKEVLAGDRVVPVNGIRWKIAYFMCRYLIEPWDSNHCGLLDLEEKQ